MYLIDIHSHILNNVDDGSRSFNESVQMINMAYDQGVRKLFCTPHDLAFLNANDTVNHNFDRLKEFSQSNYHDLELYLGSEIYCNPVDMKYIISDLASGIIPTMNKTEFVLVEFEQGIKNYNEIKQCADQLINNGYIPVIAHIERYDLSISEVKKLREIGCIMQVNYYSIFDEAKSTIKNRARSLLNLKYVDVLGSDAHRLKHRPPVISNGVDYLVNHYDNQYVNLLLHNNSERFLCRK